MNNEEQQSNYISPDFGKKASIFSKKTGLWLLANVNEKIGWPRKKALIIYRDQEILLLPASKSAYAAAAIITKDHTLTEGKVFLMQFLSALAWAEQNKIKIVQWTDSSTQSPLTKHLRLPLTKRPGITRAYFKPIALPDPRNSDSQLALTLFREGLSLNHDGYAFLSFYKIINLRYPKEQKRFIERSLPLIEDLPDLKDKFRYLKTQHTDLVAYIYESCRCAVAHASMKQTTYNPENLEDELRFYEIRPIIKELAKLIIENEFKIKSTHTIIREHFYELNGFSHILGKKTSEELKAGRTVSVSEIKLNIKISLRLWNKRKFKAFEKLKVSVATCQSGVIKLSLSRDDILKIPLTLDFPNEKLIFDPIQYYFNDDGTPNAALQLADAYQFSSETIGNAILEVWEAKNNIILGRLLEYIPIHRDGQPLPYEIIQNCKIQAKAWQEEAKRRRDDQKILKPHKI